jgi:hypothetical protein
MCHLTTVVGTFHGRVLAARLGAEGVLVVLKGTSDGLYPFQSMVDVLVPADQLALAREILLADAVDDAFADVDLETAAELALEGGGLVGEGGAATAAEPVTEADRSDSFSLRAAAPIRPRSHRRLHGLAAVLAVVMATMLIVVGCVAAAVH